MGAVEVLVAVPVVPVVPVVVLLVLLVPGACSAIPTLVGHCDAQGLLPVFADLEDGDVHHHFGARFIQVVDQLSAPASVRRAFPS
jgi:hypothetical protein